MKIHLFVLGLLFVVKADMHAYVQLGNEDGTPPEEPEYLKDIPIDYVTFDLSLPKIRGENDKSLTNEMFDHIMKTLNDPDFDVTELPVQLRIINLSIFLYRLKKTVLSSLSSILKRHASWTTVGAGRRLTTRVLRL